MDEDINDPDFILKIYYSNKGNLDQINAIIDAKLKQKRQRKISIFENYIKSRLLKNPKKLFVKGAQNIFVQLYYRYKYNKNISHWLDSFLDQYFLKKNLNANISEN